VEGTNTGHENAEGMASVGVRLTAELGNAALPSEIFCVDAIWDTVDCWCFTDELKPHGLVHRKRHRHDGASVQAEHVGSISLSLCNASIGKRAANAFAA
jgi:hypothetical protein